MMSGFLGNAPQNERMDRGTSALHARLPPSTQYMEVRQTLRGWLQQFLCGCESRNEFKYYADGQLVGRSLEKSVCCCRIFCQPCYAWTMPVIDTQTKMELLTVHRPCSCPVGPGKICGCCAQSAVISSGGEHLGRIRENCYCCIPNFNAYDEHNRHIYIIHPPTCCCGTCVNPCAENPCNSGCCCCSPLSCCRVPFWIFPANRGFFGWRRSTDGPMAHYVGKIVKKPKSLWIEMFTDANAFEVHFPTHSTTSQKAVLIGTSILFNALFFEETPMEEPDRIDHSISLCCNE